MVVEVKAGTVVRHSDSIDSPVPGGIGMKARG